MSTANNDFEEGESTESNGNVAYYWNDGRYISIGDNNVICRLHELAVIAGGADPHDVFGDDETEVHHQTHRLLNLPSTLVLAHRDDHRAVEGDCGLWFEGKDGIPRKKMTGAVDSLLMPTFDPGSTVEERASGEGA